MKKQKVGSGLGRDLLNQKTSLGNAKWALMGLPNGHFLHSGANNILPLVSTGGAAAKSMVAIPLAILIKNRKLDMPETVWKLKPQRKRLN
ncbi:MAG: hypothetical protein ABI378_14285 [Chitinophagaceae bacterium]